MTSLALQIARTQQATCCAEQTITEALTAILLANGADTELVIAARRGIDDLMLAMVRATRVLDLVSRHERMLRRDLGRRPLHKVAEI